MGARIAWILTPVLMFGVAASSSDEQVTAPELEDQPTALTTATTSSALPTGNTVIVFKSNESVPISGKNAFSDKSRLNVLRTVLQQ